MRPWQAISKNWQNSSRLANPTRSSEALEAVDERASAEKTLTSWKSWLTANNAPVMIVLFLVLGTKLVGMPVAGLLTGSQFMNCSLTSAMMLVVAGVVAGTSEADMAPRLVTLTILVGLF